MMKKWLLPVCLIGYTLVILLPPLVYGYVYPNSGDDSAAHLATFDAIKAGQKFQLLYYGQYMVGYPIVWLSNLTGWTVDAIFLWFNYLVLIGVGMTMYFVLSRIFNWQAGLAGIALTVFAGRGSLILFNDGSIYDLITVGILMPFTLYCGVMFLRKHTIFWFTSAAFMTVLTIMFHSVGIVIAGSGAVVADGISKEIVPAPSGLGFQLIGAYAIWFTAMVALYLICRPVAVWQNTTWWQKLVIIGLALLTLGLAVFALRGLTAFPYRFGINAAIVTAMLTGCLYGILVKIDKSKAFALAFTACLIVITIPGAVSYTSYNSAISKADLEALAYLNSLPGNAYSASPEVAPWVYKRFTNKEYKKGATPYLVRNKPMTYMSTPESLFFWKGGEYKTDFTKGREFSDGRVIIYVIP